MKKINIALVGLGFGGAFAEIYKEHPNVGEVTLFDTNTDLLKIFLDRIPGAKAASSFEEILENPAIDAVHLVTPIPLHAEQSIAVLNAKKHCACT
ncbi:MAG: Gfo/Idh/MocA family oxidoreductase, partial [Clostridia bacterium]|nr:Gfo/Idh/MocA family oxidoreductase [Clostridia bacterium]